MSEALLLKIAVGVFALLVIGIALTIWEFHRAGAEPVDPKRKSGNPPGR